MQLNIHWSCGLGHEHLRGGSGRVTILSTLKGEVFRSFGLIKVMNAFTNYLQICEAKHTQTDIRLMNYFKADALTTLPWV